MLGVWPGNPEEGRNVPFLQLFQVQTLWGLHPVSDPSLQSP